MDGISWLLSGSQHVLEKARYPAALLLILEVYTWNGVCYFLLYILVHNLFIYAFAIESHESLSTYYYSVQPHYSGAKRHNTMPDM